MKWMRGCLRVWLHYWIRRLEKRYYEDYVIFVKDSCDITDLKDTMAWQRLEMQFAWIRFLTSVKESIKWHR